MARPVSATEQRDLFESIRSLLGRFADLPNHEPCGDSRCIYCQKVEGKRVFELLKSLGNYLRRADGHS